MKKILSALFLASVLFVLVIGLAVPAQPEVKALQPGQDVPNISGQATLNIIKDIVNWIFYFFLLFAVVMFVVAGFYFVTAAGNPDTISKARSFVLWAVVGVAVAFLARGLIAFVSYIIGQGGSISW